MKVRIAFQSLYFLMVGYFWSSSINSPYLFVLTPSDPLLELILLLLLVFLDLDFDLFSRCLERSLVLAPLEDEFPVRLPINPIPSNSSRIKKAAWTTYAPIVVTASKNEPDGKSP